MGRPYIIILFVLISVGASCGNKKTGEAVAVNVRSLVDTVGFAQYPWQVDSIMARIGRTGWKPTAGDPWKLVICPHDDYTYTGKLYPEILQNVRSDIVILIGVAHKAASLGIEDSLVFGSHDFWRGPWGNVKVSELKSELYALLKGRCAIVSDTLQDVEHSVESLIPFLQYYNRKVSIIPILVPAMSPDRMEECGRELATAIRTVAGNHNLKWGSDYTIVATTDAVHYGNEDWGGADRAKFGCDSAGNAKARELEKEIIVNCLTGKVEPLKIRLFNDYTLNADNYRVYKWTWCGRYSVPAALYTAFYLNDEKPLEGTLAGYSTSITCSHVPVDDLRMGRTAIATMCHWVGYAALGYQQ